MDTNEYRRKIEQSVAKAQARGAKTASRALAAADAEGPRRALMDKKTTAKTRAEALGRVTREDGPDVVPYPALERLADPGESVTVRLAAIKLLQQQQFFNSVAAEWRPAFVDGLRAALRDRALRAPALEVLSLMKDRPTQELLLEGIRQPRRALVPLHEALRLLSTDIHADVIAAARKVTDTPRLRRNKPAFVQAVRILGADPGSVGTLEEVLANHAYAVDARRVAATALSNLAPDAVQRAADAAQPAARGARAGRRGVTDEAPAKPKGALARHLATLQRVRG